MFCPVYLFFIVLAVGLWPGSSNGGLFGPSNRGERTFRIRADLLTYDDVTKTYRGRGNTSIVSENEALYADAVDFNQETKDAKAWGHVRYYSGKDRLTATRVEMNLRKRTGVVYNGTLFIEKNHFYVKGDEIRKTGRASYYVKGSGSFTSCDGDSPAWQVTGRDLKVTLEGYGTVKHAALRAKSIPVLYVPYLVFPAKTKRQTGFLVPLVLFSNTNGTEFIQPFFWAINQSSDATFSEHYMAHRGWKHGIEYRYALSEWTKGAVLYDFLYDAQIDDGSADTGGGGYHYEGFRGDGANRVNRKRWWFRMKADWDLASAFKAKLDLDVVSDQDYLREFNTTYSGYEYTEAYFAREFGRELDDETDTVRLNQFNVNKTWDQFSLNMGLKWYDDIIARKDDQDDTTQQSLPAVTFSGAKQKIGETPWYFDLDSSFHHYWRDMGTRGYTADVSPRLYYPMTLWGCLDFEPSVGVRETLWQVEAYGPSAQGKEDRLESRELFDFKADLSTEIARVFDVGAQTVDKIRHAIRPQVVYSYVPDVEQTNLPDYVATVSETNLVSYALTSTLTARRVSGADPEEASQLEVDAWEAWASDTPGDLGAAARDDTPYVPQYAYHEFCRMTLSQSYDILAARRAPPPGEKRKPFSDVSARLELIPFYNHDAKLVANATWSPYDGETSYDAIADLALKDRRGDWVSATYRYVKDDSSDLLAKVFVNVMPAFSVYWEQEHNFKDSKALRSILGVKYAPQCWSFYVQYTHDRAVNEREYMFVISLHGLGKYDLGRYRPGYNEKWYSRG